MKKRPGKVCEQCGKHKPYERFNIVHYGDGRSIICTYCVRLNANPELKELPEETLQQWIDKYKDGEEFNPQFKPEACTAGQGTKERLKVYAERIQTGQELFSEADKNNLNGASKSDLAAFRNSKPCYDGSNQIGNVREFSQDANFNSVVFNLKG